MKNINKKGFTLIELLAVIVILGLLMAIAIPSVTKYITQSRKKTLVSTMDNYIKSVVNEVNDMEYTFTDSNTIYAVPIECIALESGGADPFGEWYESNDAYWAYVLVQYDDVSSSYTYGFTFKDSAGYGLIPTTENKINHKNINTGTGLKRPSIGSAKTYSSIWNGFVVDNNTKLQVLFGTKIGDGKNTCTIKQDDKNNGTIPPKESKPASTTLFWSYNNGVLTISSNDISKQTSAGGSFSNHEFTITTQPWSVFQSSVTSVRFDGVVAPTSMANWFALFTNVTSYDFSNLYTNNVTSLMQTFAGNESLVSLDVSSFDTSKVKNLYSTFSMTSNNIHLKELKGIEYWDTSNVSDMRATFQHVVLVPELDLSRWNTSKVTNMQAMFGNGRALDNITVIKGLENWDTSNVTNMNAMFVDRSFKEKVLDLSGWDTSKVTDMLKMFYNDGRTTDYLETIYVSSKWNVSNVTYSTDMFLGRTKLKGAVAYDLNKVDKTMANYTTGYLTKK